MSRSASGSIQHQLARFAPSPNLGLLQRSLPQHLRARKPAVAAAVFQVYKTSSFRIRIQIKIYKLMHSYLGVCLLALHAKLMAARQVLGYPSFLFYFHPPPPILATLYYTVLGLSENAGSYTLGP